MVEKLKKIAKGVEKMAEGVEKMARGVKKMTKASPFRRLETVGRLQEAFLMAIKT